MSSSNDIFILLLLVLYLSIIYMISVGIFKRKKWSTLLSGPFSKKDIRRRELILVIMSTMVFFIIYYILIISGYIRNSELISYLNVFNNVIILDFIRMFSISILVIGGLFFLDSLFSNLYMLIFSVVFIGIYSITLILNIEFLFNYYIRFNSIVKPITNFIFNYNYYNTKIIEFFTVAIMIILIGIILGLISSLLTNKIKVENMTNGIMFKIPKKVGLFMIYTFNGLLLSPFIVETINVNLFYSSMDRNVILIIGIICIIVLSVISYFIVRKIKGKRKSGLIT
ncbi:Hypothetical Uncharacterized protein [Clostridium chauvoei JF4335]|nr:Hypothetical Uncharacterized protein [Clostridium chauvoei JF4335]